MLRTIFIAGALLFVGVLAVWIHVLRDQNEKLTIRLRGLQQQYTREQERSNQLQDKLAREANALNNEAGHLTQSRENLQAQLALETKKLNALKNQLRDLKAVPETRPTDDPDSQIQNDRDEIEHAQKRLAWLNDENHSVEEQSKSYLDQQAYQRDSTKIELQKQMNGLDQQIRADQDQITSLQKDRSNPNRQQQIAQLRDEIVRFKNQKQQLSVQKSELDLQHRAKSSEVADEVRHEKDGVLSEKQMLNKNIGEWKADLEHWKKIKDDRAKAKPESASIQSLRKDIAAESDKVSNLQKTLQSLKPD